MAFPVPLGPPKSFAKASAASAASVRDSRSLASSETRLLGGDDAFRRSYSGLKTRSEGFYVWAIPQPGRIFPLAVSLAQTTFAVQVPRSNFLGIFPEHVSRFGH